jgi:hypothetical protein
VSPWIKHEHADLIIPPQPTCGVCGRVTTDPQYACAEMACPYPAAPVAVEPEPEPEPETEPVEVEEAPTEETPVEPAPDAPPEQA